jgi:hypothetical protein
MAEGDAWKEFKRVNAERIAHFENTRGLQGKKKDRERLERMYMNREITKEQFHNYLKQGNHHGSEA